MADQAAQLRALVQSVAQTDSTVAHHAPRKIVVCGSKGGVGATSVALSLSAACARKGVRIVLVDADLNQPDVAALCQVEARDTICDVLAERRTVHEALHRGPAGMLILPGDSPATKVPDCSPAAQERLLRELDRLGRHTDVVVIDAGSGLTQVVRRFWKAADAVLLVTTPERIAIIDAYAAIKVLGADRSGRVALIINRATPESAAEAHHRIDHACQRFLGRNVELAGHVADAEGGAGFFQIESGARGECPDPLTDGIRDITERVLATVGQHDRCASSACEMAA